jgi:YHS domain-containing protein
MWQALQYLIGLHRLGYEVYYAEETGALPYDPRVKSAVVDPTYNVSCLQQTLERFGFADHWVYWDMGQDRHYGLSRDQLQVLYETADVILNLCGATPPRATNKGRGRWIYIETDPVFEQIRAAQGEPRTLDFLARHDACFTYGENLGAPDCPIPLAGVDWQKTRPPVVLDLWKERVDPACRHFTTVATWHSKGKDITFQGQTYYWSKHVNFIKFLDLPRHTQQSLELAVETGDDMSRAQLAAHGWHLADAAERSATVEDYREYISTSRGEFTVAKDIYVRPRTGWFSDRSVCYLAAGKPVVTQETGFSKFIPTGQGLLAFSTLEEAVSALATINADYVRHAHAAREIAVEYFAADKVLRKLLRDAGVE